MATGGEKISSSVDKLVKSVSSSLSISNDKEEASLSGEKSEFDRENFKMTNLRLLRTVGTGTFGRVMVAEDKNNSKAFYALKILIINDIFRLKQVEHVQHEKSILNSIKHPFLVEMLWTGHDCKFLYMLFTYVPGGEMFTYLREAGKFSNSQSQFYAAEIITAIAYLHSKDIGYRDMKPENILIDELGHVKIVDFGFAKEFKYLTYTMCGTPEYLAPEIIQGKGYTKGVDWWGVGILIHEMLIGSPPFYSENTSELYGLILKGNINYSGKNMRHLDHPSKDILKKLLVNDPNKRFGCTHNGVDDIKEHSWFKNLDWRKAETRKLVPMFVPKVNGNGDTNCYDNYEEMNWKLVLTATPAQQEKFNDF